MKQQSQQSNYITNALEYGLLEQELRAQAQRAAALAMARVIRRAFAKVRSLVSGARQTNGSGLRSA